MIIRMVGQAKRLWLDWMQTNPTLAVPNRNPRYDQIHTLDQIFPHVKREIEHFFSIYKELEGKVTHMAGWGGPKELEVLQSLRSIVSYQFHDTSSRARIRLKWSIADGHRIKEDGGNLGAFLMNLRRSSPAHYRRIAQTIRLILPFFADFEFVDDFGYVLLQWRETGADHVFGASQASDGMLRAMALVALLQQPEANLPDVLILDEPELGLHPYAIEVIASLIRSASHHVQVIIATQSVSLIDQFDPSDIVVVDRHSGETSLRRLNESELSEWLREYSLSELWEKNVLGGRPSR